jgi:hypothetical protein
MRAFVITSFALALALVPAAALAQATQPPAGQTPPAAAAQPPAPAEPKIPFTTPAGMLLVSIKPDKTAVFEEMIAKLKAGFAKSQDEALKKQAPGIKIYKASELSGPNALYVVLVDPAVPASEYDLFQMLAKTMTPDEQRAPETAEMWKRFADAFASGMNKLNLTLIGG